jgi:hypothetical protein
MTDYTKLVKALRYCTNEDNVCTKEKNCGYYGKGFFCQDALMNDAADAIEDLDAKADYWMGQAQEEYEKRLRQMPKRGEWIVNGANRIDCSVCGHSVCFAFGLSDGSFYLYKYCPNCGAKMIGEQNVE